MDRFKLKSKFDPAGDQPGAIEALFTGLENGLKHQTLLGVTGSGKTFTVANVIEKINKPTLIIAHNKTLAAQLAQEFSQFFPDNAVHYFVSYYDYYQPEAYVPTSDTYIEKEAQINEEIDRLRHASTESLLTRKDVIIVASVSCIYGLGSPQQYLAENLLLQVGHMISRREIMQRLILMHFGRTTLDLTPGTFRAIGNKVEIMPVSERVMYSIVLSGGVVDTINVVDPISSKILDTVNVASLFPAKHFLTEVDERERAVQAIRAELKDQLAYFRKQGKLLEADRLMRRTKYDIAMIREVGYCNGIENYSRHMSGRSAGEAPDTLLSYFPHKDDGTPDFLTVIDESHVTVPQIGGMYNGDASRKKTLVEHGFRLPSALDNRPLKFSEFNERVGQVLYTTATPADYERELSKPPEGSTVEQVVRPTGLLDPKIEVRAVSARADGSYNGQVQDFIVEAEKEIAKGDRVIATTLTKKMAEDLASYLKEKKIKSEYLHSDIKTIERIQILSAFRRGDFDVLVGVNLLREGLDLPELSLIGILDADKEGFLRSETSLIQIIGRAARNASGRVILYADRETGSMKRAIGETERRRKIQEDYNKRHGITPKTIKKKIHDITEHLESLHDKAVEANLAMDKKVAGDDKDKLISLKQKQMNEAVKNLDFETAAILRDEIKALHGEPAVPKKPKKAD